VQEVSVETVHNAGADKVFTLESGRCVLEVPMSAASALCDRWKKRRLCAQGTARDARLRFGI